MDEVVEITGLEDIERRLHELGPKLATKALKKALTAAGEVMQAAVEARAPYGPHRFKSSHEVIYGALQQSIDVVTQMLVLEDGGMVRVGPDKRAFWALFLEFGTCKMAAHPFIRPAFDDCKQDALDAFVDVMQDMLPSVVKE